jgi:hypothetical protein
MTQANPGVAMSNVTTAGAQTGVDLTGGTTAMAAVAVSLIVTVTNWAASYDSSQVVAPPLATVGLEVSLDNTNYVRIGVCSVSGNGQFRATGSFPCRYARAVLDTLDSRISAVTFNASVAGAS